MSRVGSFIRAAGTFLLALTLAGTLSGCGSGSSSSSGTPAVTALPSAARGPAAVNTVLGPTSTRLAIPGTGEKEALGTNNPLPGDCTSNTSEAATAVGFVMLSVTTSAFRAEIQVQSGSPSATYTVFMQQVPGSCPQQTANGGTLTTDATGRGQAVATVPRVPGATTFFAQLVPAGSGPATYTSDRISLEPQR